MPRSSALREDRFKPGIFDRLKQSAEDKKRRGHLKLAATPTAPVAPPIRIEGGFFNNTVTVRTVADTTTFNDPWDQWVGQPLTAQTMNGIYQTTNAWLTWNQMTVTSANTNAVTWRVWTTGGMTTGVTTGNTIDCWDTWQQPIVRYQDAWGRWIDTPAYGANLPPRRFEQVPERYRVQESEEQKRAREFENARWEAEVKERQRRMDEEQKAVLEANSKAMQLLKCCLTPEQKACLEKNRYFIVTAKSGRRYRIDEGSHGNVKVLDRDNKVIERLCIQPNGVPIGDSMLAQKLMIEAAEDVFRQHANITLNDGRIIYGSKELLDGDKLATVIPIRRAA